MLFFARPILADTDKEAKDIHERRCAAEADQHRIAACAHVVFFRHRHGAIRPRRAAAGFVLSDQRPPGHDGGLCQERKNPARDGHQSGRAVEQAGRQPGHGGPSWEK